jgi:hypothetical protein
VLLLLLGLIASAAVTFYMTAIPDLFVTSNCEEVASNPPRWLLANQEFDGSECWWRNRIQALAHNGDPWSVDLDRRLSIVQTEGDKPRVVLTASAPSDSALIRKTSTASSRASGEIP